MIGFRRKALDWNTLRCLGCKRPFAEANCVASNTGGKPDILPGDVVACFECGRLAIAGEKALRDPDVSELELVTEAAAFFADRLPKRPASLH